MDDGATYAEVDLLPLSGLQHLAFCERRWALVELERQWEENLFTTQGELLHETAHSGRIESRPGSLIRRTVPLHSFRLGLTGQADVVEFLPCAAGQPGIAVSRRKGLWQPYPIEYKRSLDKRGSEAYRVQLCAQAICLEEMLGARIPAGALFDGQKRRRQEIEFSPGLRSEVERLAARMHTIHQAGNTPPAVYGKKCHACSLSPVCLPIVESAGSASAYLRRAVQSNLRQSPGGGAEGAVP